jgi:Phage tail tube protein
MAQAAGVFKTVAYKAEVTYGTVPVAASAQALRRVTSDLSLTKQTYQSNEIRTDQQVGDFRHGVRSVEGTIAGELSPKTYADFIAAALRRDFAAVSAMASLSITIAGTAPTQTVTRAAGSFLTDGVKIGDVVRLTAGTFTAGNLNNNMLVTAVSASALTVRTLNGSTITNEGPIASATVTVVGKKTYAPASGHTNKSFSIEHWFSDVTLSETFAGCQPTQIGLQLPPTGISTISIGMMGKNLTTAGAQYFTSPTAQTTTGVAAAVNGVLMVGGVAMASVTGMSLTIDSARTGDAVVGSNTIDTRFPGRIAVSGQITAYLESGTLRDAFLNETETSIVVALTTDNTNSASFVGITLPRVKLGGNSKSDGEGGIVQTIPFTALYNTTGGAGISSEATTIVVQDSDA